ncbi:MotA/TolQ/ExbB proton channel family protein [uncultured Roseivirga sp.]|uniref:MotA/TolQ/ExbB proton channel family protein n=1 Tax=uncultured Roseivirga sp. TaxID=543088 RepID=UPI0030D97D51|tara:strand:+ start:935 stop:1309 length:375 start_codon:yes stop_codon:yes gene_type:complete
MLELFFSGSKLFMGIQTIVAVIMIVMSVYSAKNVLTNQVNENSQRKISLIKEVGLFAFIIGLLASAMDLMGALQAIEMAGDVSPSLLAAGLKISFITPTYGLMIYTLSLLIYFALRAQANKTAE